MIELIGVIIFSRMDVKGVEEIKKPVVEIKEPVIEQSDKGAVNWTENMITAKGYGVIDSSLPLPQAKLMAQRAAIVDAQRNLLEIIKGVRITSETKVQDMMTKSDYIITRIDGIVKGARMLGEPIVKDGIVEVELGIPLYGDTSSSLAPLFTRRGGKEHMGEAMGNVPMKNIIIDAENAEIKPTLFPRIVDENGNVIFDPSQYPEIARSPYIKYVKKTGEILDELGYGDNIIVKAMKGEGNDIVIKKEDKEKFDIIRKGLDALITGGKLLLMLL